MRGTGRRVIGGRGVVSRGDCLAASDPGVTAKMLRRGFIRGKSGAGFGVEGVTCKAGHGILAYCWLEEGGERIYGYLAV